MHLNRCTQFSFVIIMQVWLTSTSCTEQKSYLKFETVQRPINQSIVTHIEQAESLLHCAYKCQRRPSESLYFNDSDQRCYCNNDSDTNTHQDGAQPPIIYGGYKRSHEIVRTTDSKQTPDESTTESVALTSVVTSPASSVTVPQRPDGPIYEDCVQLYEAGYQNTDRYQIYIRQFNKHVYVMCIMMSHSVGPLTIVQLRNNKSPSFYRNWSDYVSGFGTVEEYGTYWLGLENIAAMTNGQQYGLEIYMIPEITMPNKIPKFVSIYFDKFALNPEDNYRMTLSDPKEDNDCLPGYDAAFFGDGQRFSTFDKDNDLKGTINCAEMLRGAWWFKDCGFEMNGRFTSKAKTAPFMTFSPCWDRDVKLSFTSMAIYKRNFSGS